MSGPWMWRWRHCGRGRPPRPRRIFVEPSGVVSFIPLVNGIPSSKEPVYLAPDEYEAYRLVYYMGLSQEEAAKRMSVSRGTLWRLLDSARRKIGIALAEYRPIVVSLKPVEQ